MAWDQTPKLDAFRIMGELGIGGGPLTVDVRHFPIADVVEVLAGDTLSAIAERCYGDAHEWPRIFKANRETIGRDANLIFPGQRLLIPARPWP